MEHLDEEFNVNDYDIKEKIGEGQYGTVYKAIRKTDLMECAVKIILKRMEIEKNILRESSILKSIQHSSVLKFFGAHTNSYEIKIFTEYLPNGSLKSKLHSVKKDENWTTTKKYIALIGISDAMRYLHEHNIIHRDLKPENVMIDSNYYPRLCDFGLSRFLPDELTDSGNAYLTVDIGTPCYMAPEMIDDSSNEYDRTVDVYAFGIMANEIFSEKLPYFSENKKLKLNKFQLHTQVIHGHRPTLAKNISEEVGKLIKRCWSQTVADRPQFDEIFEFLTSDLSYINEDVNKEEIQKYINFLNEEREKEKEMKKGLSVDDDDDNNDDNDEDEKFVVYPDKKSSINYKLYETSHYAEVFKSPKASGVVVIPAFIKFGSIKYNVTKIGDKAFYNSNITKLKFSPKSVLNSIGNKVFKKSTINEITLPKSLTELKPFWIKGANKLEKVNIEEENSLFSSKDGFLFRNYTDETSNTIIANEIIFASHNIEEEFSVSEKTARIGDFSFSNILNIKSFESNNSKLSGIGSYSFFRCEKLQTFVYTNEKQDLTLFNFCFSNCWKLSKVEIHCRNLTTLNSCFHNCQSLASIEISAKSVELDPETFKGFTGELEKEISFQGSKLCDTSKLPKMNISKLSNIDTSILPDVDVSKLSEVDISKLSEVDISKDNFYWPSGLKSVSFKNVGKVTLGKQIFSKAKKLEVISIEDSIYLNIGEECFSESVINKIKLYSCSITLSENFASKCLKLTDVDINCYNDINLNENSFKDSNSLVNISIKAASNLAIPCNFLSNSKNLNQVKFGGKAEVTIGDNSFNECTSLTYFEIFESGNITLGKNEFVNCSKLNKISIESSENSQVLFGSNCFSQCSGLLLFDLKRGKLTINNNSFLNNQKLTILNLMKLDDLTIGDEQFMNSKSLQNAFFKLKSNISLGKKCFSNSENLGTIKILSTKDRLIDVNINDECFSNCKSLNEVTFGNIKDLTLCSNIFTMCTNLVSIKIEAKIITIKKNCFNDSSLQTIDIGADKVTIEDNAFTNNEKITAISIRALYITLQNNSFSQNINLKDIKLEATSQLDIGESCFAESISLNSLKMFGDIINIKKNCFNNCSKLKALEIINSNNIIIGENAFTGCNEIEEIKIVSPKYFRAFENCFSSLDKLKSVIITSNQVCFGLECFASCTKLQKFSIKGEHIEFDRKCFFNCSSLNNIQCFTATHISYYNTSFDGKNLENFIKNSGHIEFELKMEVENVESPSKSKLSILKKLIPFSKS